jgi:hypothetical protein
VPRSEGQVSAPRLRAIAQLEKRHPELKHGMLAKLAHQAIEAEKMLHPKSPIADREKVQAMYDRVIKYMLPQLRSVEFKGDESSAPIQITIKPV